MMLAYLLFPFPVLVATQAAHALLAHKQWQSQVDEQMARQQREYEILILEHMWRQME